MSASSAAQLASDSTAAQSVFVSSSLNSAEQPAASLRSKRAKHRRAAAPKRMLMCASSAAQPASNTVAASLASAIPSESLLLIVRYMAAHNLETTWPEVCSECNPYWYNWYCHECQQVNRFLPWSPTLHFGHCDQSCSCCRSANGDLLGGCTDCDNLWNLKVTCSRMRDLLKTYSGT